MKEEGNASFAASEDYIDTKDIRNSNGKETARIAKQEAGRVLRQTAGPFISPSCASVPAGRRFFHARQLSSPVSSARLLRYHPVVDEVVNDRIERNARICCLCRVDAASKSLRTHAGEGATIRDRPIVAREK